MAKDIDIKLVGLELLYTNFKKLPIEIKKEITDAAIAEFTQAANDAKGIVGTHNYTGDLAQKISVTEKDGKVFYQSLSDHAAFAEFGIRGSVRPTSKFQNIARKFIGINRNSSGLTAKSSIYRWAQFRGIDKQFWYPIYRKIMGQPIKGSMTGFLPINNGIGYFFVPFEQARKRLIIRANSIVKKMTK